MAGECKMMMDCGIRIKKNRTL